MPVLVGGLVWAGALGAQASTGTITGRVVDSTAQQPLSNVTVSVVGTQLGALSRNDGGFTLANVPAGAQRVRVARIGYASKEVPVTVNPGATATITVNLSSVATALTEVVVVGYGTQRREAVTGSVATVQAEQANVGVIQNANQLLTARVAGVNITANNGEPGGGAQIRVRGGTSITASNEPLYVIDGVPLQNDNAVASGLAIGNSASLSRSPLNSLNPNDIQSITVLKDASATAIYGSRGANGVVLIETKRGQAGASQVEYETYFGAATAARTLDFLNGNEYRNFVEQQISSGALPATARSSLGSANTDWEDEVTRVGYTQNHNLSFSGGSQTTQYRAALNYFDQQGVVIANGLARYQGRINATTQAFQGKLQTGVNLTASRVNNKYLPFDNTAGFDGGVFTNVAVFNPTQPVFAQGGTYYEVGTGAQSVRNPVALARQITDVAPENRVLGNINASYALLPSLTARTTVGIDYSNSVRQTYFPLASPVGASTGGRARQAERSLQNVNFQGLLTYAPQFSDNSDLEVLGGYEFSEFDNRGFEAEARGFRTDAFRFDNLGAGTQASSPPPTSYIEESRLVSFFGRANYGFRNKYFLTGVLRYDGSSRLAEGNKWSLFPAVSASWRLSEEEFLKDGPFSTLSLRAGFGRQGNQAVRPYGTQLLFRSNNDARYPFGSVLINGFAATQVANPDLKWETSEQLNIGLDYGFSNNRFTGVLDFYQKDTKDLLLDVPVAQPAVVANRVENIGKVRNRGVELSLDANILEGAARTLTSGLVFNVNRNEVVELGLGREFLANIGTVSGQGQSGRFAQRLIPGQPIGTFWGPRFVGFNAQNKQVFACSRSGSDCVNGQTTAPTGDDEAIIGDANPDFSLGFRSNLTWNKFDASWLWRGEFGADVFNNTALVYSTTANAAQGRNFLASALEQQDAFLEPAIYSSRWIENGSFVRLQNVTLGYRLNVAGRDARLYVSGDNLLLFTGYDGYDPEVFVRAGDGVTGSASRGIDYLAYPRARTFTAGARIQF
ncbi:TonB-dependent receptor [Roseisolibacter sp. H3M3-2]|uniref:SusC/RagA family TonB-linked outer membrane protein n=1 Tax=Roseisolibacter sp. H3M3-2 TaxID=3031323 RepID=UPI0023DA8AF8|nr:TonB-dependent receptor [Roseisolibacter sp. H3M3-2]MDF1503470.1 TonB-dependent receptor [Roseisolibacter sp. H3M3-2]